VYIGETVSEDKLESNAALDAPEASGTRGSISAPRPSGSGRHEGEDPLIGKVIEDRVRIVRTIARGGMGKVYYAEQIALGRPCAVKVLDVRMAGGDANEYAKRFLLEASVSSKLTHPNVVTIFDYGKSEDGTCWLAMEYLEGKTLANELKTGGRLAPDRAISIARQVCRALREAHALGVVHRDLKPGNVFLAKHDDEGDFVKVLDFGLVKETHPPEDGNTGAHGGVTQIGQVMGSPRYMAPEQVQGKPVDARTDIYALGCVMYAMLTGKPPFDKPNEMTTMMAHVSEPVPGMGAVAPGLMLPEGLEGIVLKCLAKDPKDRFNSMEELLAALKLHGPMVSATTGSGVHVAAMMPPDVRASIPSGVPDPTPRPSNAKWLVLLAVLALGAGGFFLWKRSTSSEEDGPRPAVSVTAPPPPVTTSAPAPPPPPVATIVLRVETEPPGAKVKEDDAEVCAATPCDIEYKGDQADAGIEHLLVIQKPHYKVEKKLVHAGGGPVVIKLRPN
jgi:serine/threonine-protein kinase